MGGGLYRSANSMPEGAEPPADGVPMVSAYPLDEPMVETTSPAPEMDGAGGGSAAANSTVMAIGSLVSRGTGFLRTLIITAALGTTIGDAYTTAQVFPGMVYEFLLGGILTSVLVPVLVRRRKLDADGGESYTQRLLTLSVLALGVAAAIAVAIAPWLTVLYTSEKTDAATHDLIVRLSWLMLPMLFFTGISALLAAVLNTRGHFAAPMWTPILNNLVVIGTFGLYVATFGVSRDLAAAQVTPGRILLVGGGTLLGVMIQAAGLAPALRKVGFRWRWRGQFRTLGLRELGRLGGWMFCYVAVSQIGLIVLFRIANAASAEKKAGPLIYNNVFLLLMMAHGIVAVSIITALMPRMSAASADGRFRDMTADLSRGTRMVTAVLAPIAVCYAVLAKPAAVLLFQRGAFTAEDALMTAPVLLVAGVALIPFAISQLFTFAFYALPDTKTPALINIPVVVLRVLVQIGLFVAFSVSFAATGLMLGNAVSYIAAAAVSAWLLRGRVGQLGMAGIAASFGKVIAAALGAALVGLVVLALLPGGNPPSHVQSVVQIVVGGAAIGVTYLGLGLALRLHEIGDVVRLVRRKLGVAGGSGIKRA